MTRKTGSILKSVFLGIVAIVIGVVLCAYAILHFSLPATDRTVALRDINNSVEITFDSLGIPQIWAQDEYSAYFALGWQHSADRMFQIDFTRRVAQGRLSEMLGEVTVSFDKRQRRVGHTRLAQNALSRLSETNRGLLQAYADGINAYKRECTTLPFEFYLLPVDFEEWTVYDCLTILSFQTWYSDALQNHDVRDLAIARMNNYDLSQLLIHPYPDSGLTTVHSDEKESEKSRSALDNLLNIFSISGNFRNAVAKNIMRYTPNSYTATTSSNAWVVAPARSESGYAMMASDPHLELTRLPQFWYAVGLHIANDSVDAVGITVPGMPFVIMGHNKETAWSFTAGGVDLTDFYEEVIDADDTTRYMTRFNEQPTDKTRGSIENTPNEWQVFDEFVDTILVVGTDKPEIMTTRTTRHGPVVSQNAKLNRVRTSFWAGYDADLDQAVTSGFALISIGSFEQFQSAVTSMGALNANWMYADKNGNIGYQLGAPVPIRPKHWNGGLLPGWTSEHEWQGYLPVAETPNLLNPQRGWIANSNNRPSSNHNIPGNYASDRIIRITHLLDSLERFSADNMRAFQLDLTDAYLLQWRDLLLPLVADQNSAIAKQLSDWDGDCSASSNTTELINAVIDQFVLLTFDELGQNASQVSWNSLHNLLLNGPDSLFDIQATQEIETRHNVLSRALSIVLQQSVAGNWGEHQTLTMRHPLAANPIVDWVMNLTRGPWPRGGTKGTLNSSFSVQGRDKHYRVSVGPSMRSVIDFADIDSATLVLPAGNSGNPMSDHFFDFNRLWQEGKTWTLPISREAVQQKAISTLTLQAIQND